MKTIKLPIQNLPENDKNIILDLQRNYNSCVRIAYNRFHKDKLNQKEVRNYLKDISNIDSWYTQCAIIDGQSLQKRFKDKKVIFGGKTNLKRYLKKLISKDEYKKNKLRPIQIQGEAPKKGNRKFILDLENNQIIFKVKKGLKINLKLPKLRKNIKRELQLLELKTKNNEMPFMVSLDSESISIIFEETKIESLKTKNIKNRIMGIDLNPNYIGLSIVQNEKILFKQVIDLKQLNILTGKSSSSKESKARKNKKRFEIIEISKYIFKLAQHWKCEKVVLEELKIKSSNKGKGRLFNRLCNNDWNRGLFVSNITKRLNLFNIKLVLVNPAYSSFIGNINHGSDKTPDMVASSIELARRGLNKYIKGKFYPEYKNNDNLKNLWKEDLDWSSYTWKELFRQAKKMELKYRFPIRNDSLFRNNFKTNKSKIILYNFY